MRLGQVERRTHDETRPGTISLFAALDIAAGAVIGRCYPQFHAGDIVILDIHKVAGVKEAIQSRGANLSICHPTAQP
jgi:hypothetical protein